MECLQFVGSFYSLLIKSNLGSSTPINKDRLCPSLVRVSKLLLSTDSETSLTFPFPYFLKNLFVSVSYSLIKYSTVLSASCNDIDIGETFHSPFIPSFSRPKTSETKCLSEIKLLISEGDNSR